jgi:hypothetical protein
MSKTNETPNLPSGQAIVRYCAKYIVDNLTDEQKTGLTRIFISMQSNVTPKTNKEKKI